MIFSEAKKKTSSQKKRGQNAGGFLNCTIVEQEIFRTLRGEENLKVKVLFPLRRKKL